MYETGCDTTLWTWLFSLECFGDFDSSLSSYTLRGWNLSDFIPSKTAALVPIYATFTKDEKSVTKRFYVPIDHDNGMTIATWEDFVYNLQRLLMYVEDEQLLLRHILPLLSAYSYRLNEPIQSLSQTFPSATENEKVITVVEFFTYINHPIDNLFVICSLALKPQPKVFTLDIRQIFIVPIISYIEKTAKFLRRLRSNDSKESEKQPENISTN
ncbi:MAG: hypothetical protein QXH92_03870 [Candidatus Aenigmatarchaeota archaeon]